MHRCRNSSNYFTIVKQYYKQKMLPFAFVFSQLTQCAVNSMTTHKIKKLKSATETVKKNQGQTKLAIAGIIYKTFIIRNVHKRLFKYHFCKTCDSHLDTHILELFYVQRAWCICNTDRVTEMRVGRRDQYCKSDD